MNTSEYFRWDLDWENLTKYLSKKFKSQKKVMSIAMDVLKALNPFHLLCCLWKNWNKKSTKILIPIMQAILITKY